MPLIKRIVEPIDLSRAEVPKGVANELEYIVNWTFANVIRQLSSLSHHAEDIFSELCEQAAAINDRRQQLETRISNMKAKAAQLDFNIEEVTLQDIHIRKPYRSSTVNDQQLVTVNSRSKCLNEVYTKHCKPAPPLTKLNVYREDGKDSLKFYTDPSYFFDLWCKKIMEQSVAIANQKKKPKKQQSSPKKATNIKGPKKTVWTGAALGVEFMNKTVQDSSGQQDMPTDDNDLPSAPDFTDDMNLPPPPPSCQVIDDDLPCPPKFRSSVDRSSSIRPQVPPPPPPPDGSLLPPVMEDLPSPPPSILQPSPPSLIPPPPPPPSTGPPVPPPPPSGPGILPPPPPPPPPPMGAPMPPPPPSIGSVTLKPKSEKPAVKPPEVQDMRSDLLGEIRKGLLLRKAEERKINEVKQVPNKAMGVQAIMEAAFEQRRKAMEDSDSEAGSDPEDDDAWN